MTAHLRPCPSCRRHLRTSDTACPFCAAPVPDELRAARPPRLPGQPMSRAALVMFTLLGAPACTDDDGAAPPPVDAREAGPDQAVYGAPPPDGGADSMDAGPDSKPDGGADTSDAATSDVADTGGTDQPVYGAPPPEMGGSDAAYGAPPPDAAGSD
jgi:hypothetical protein